MKKIFFSFIFAFALILTSGIFLTACDGNNESNKIKVTMEQYSGDGISSVALYAVSKADFEKADDTKGFSLFTNRGNLYGWGNSSESPKEAKTVSLNEGEYVAVVAMSIEESHSMLAPLTGNSDIKLEINGVVSNFYSTSIFNGTDVFVPFTGYQYWTFVGVDFFKMSEEDAEVFTFSGDITVKLVGNATIKTYEPKITLKNYDANNTKYNDLVFNLYKNDSLYKSEISALELKAACEEEKATYYDVYKLEFYFADHAKFFPNYKSIDDFTNNRGSKNENLEIEFYELRYQYKDDHEIVLDFSVFDDITVEDLSMISFEKWYWENSSFAIYDSMYADGNYQFIVDGKAPQNTLTLAEYRAANNVKVKTIVSELVALILKDSSMTLASGNTQFADSYLTADDIQLGDPVADKPGYRYVTIDFGDYKSYRGENYNTLYFRAYYGVSQGEGMYAMYPYNFNSLKQQLQKVEFANETICDLEGYGYVDWDGLKSARDNRNQIAYLGDEPADEFDYYAPQDGCYYFGGEVELFLGRGGSYSGYDSTVNTLELTISREGEDDITITLTRDNYTDQNWTLNGTYDWITCEFDNDIYQTRLVIKSDKVTKVSGKLTVTLANQ